MPERGAGVPGGSIGFCGMSWISFLSPTSCIERPVHTLVIVVWQELRKFLESGDQRADASAAAWSEPLRNRGGAGRRMGAI